VKFLKHKIEKWLHAIVAEEVSKIDASLQRERVDFNAQVQSFRAQFDEVLRKLVANSDHTSRNFNDAAQHLIEVRENATLRGHIKELEGRLVDLRCTFEQVFPTHTF
jgi:hypothetical protein